MSVERSSEPFQIGEWRVEPALDQLSKDGEFVKLEPRTMRLLLRLSAAAGEVVSSRQLLDDVWSGVVVGPASLYQGISQLRKLLADTEPSPAYIATVPRKGYRLIAPVRRIDHAESPPTARARMPVMQLHRWLATTVLLSISATAFALWLQDSPPVTAVAVTPGLSSSCDDSSERETQSTLSARDTRHGVEINLLKH